MLAHQRFHIHPGRIGTLGQRILALIDLIVEDLQANVGNTDIINIREDKGDLGLNLVPRSVQELTWRELYLIRIVELD